MNLKQTVIHPNNQFVLTGVQVSQGSENRAADSGPKGPFFTHHVPLEDKWFESSSSSDEPNGEILTINV